MIGVPLRKSTENRRIVIGFAVTFGLMTPVGIGIGWLFENVFNGYIADFLVCAAAGTFIYVAIIEVLVPEFGNFDDRFDDMRFQVRGSVGNSNNKQIMYYGSIDMTSHSSSSKNDKIGDLKTLDETTVLKQTTNNELSDMMHLAIRMGCVCLGFGLMSLLAAWV